MDIGGEGHILLSDSLAKALLALKDEYKPIINYIGDYSIKHGQVLTLYSAYSDEFRVSDVLKSEYNVSSSTFQHIFELLFNIF